jgi:hypothetical protein
MKFTSICFGTILLGFSSCQNPQPPVTMADLFDEMTDLQRLTSNTEKQYRVVQYSSYDRRSRTAADTTWFCNEDGFGGEPIPNFESVLVQPDSGGTGEYLICDINSPGVVQRLWSASISGKIRFYLDDMEKPVYEGDALDFFWKPIEMLAGLSDSVLYSQTFRQFDATYLPIPFSKRCRIEWIGNIAEPHFYHVGVRIYNPGIRVETFSPLNFNRYIKKFEEINHILADPANLNPINHTLLQRIDTVIEPDDSKYIYELTGPGAIEFFQIKIAALYLENALRQTLLTIRFDDAPVPQVQSPLGDFFGAAPGLNPFQSVPFSVETDSTLICRFIMPFKKSARIEIKNLSTEKIHLKAQLKPSAYDWNEGESMHFQARWSSSNNLTAFHTDARTVDIPYLKARGSGRMVGAAAYLYNPSPVSTSWGNWWGEGDEKIFVDHDTFPAFFGTGSEDYFNYSWSSSEIFSWPYCGQPRNDGPGNRGYVSNFRWHIADDIPFAESLRFFMELRHHGMVPGFIYSRIIYYYALPGISDDYAEPGPDDLGEIRYSPWSPAAYLGCEGYDFIQAEKLAVQTKNLILEPGKLWADENILTWQPTIPAEKLTITIRSKRNRDKTPIGFTVAHSPDGGTIRCSLNGKPIRIGSEEQLSLSMPHSTVLSNHFTERVDLKTGNNELVFELINADGKRKMQIDYVWLKN